MSDRRRVEMTTFENGGATLLLECGHKKWIGGLPKGTSVLRIRCGQHPCYKPGRYMGNDPE